MDVVVNGQARTLPEGTTVAALLEELSLPPDGVAVAIDLDVIPRTQHAGRILRAGEKVEIIRAVGGG